MRGMMNLAWNKVTYENVEKVSLIKRINIVCVLLIIVIAVSGCSQAETGVSNNGVETNHRASDANYESEINFEDISYEFGSKLRYGETVPTLNYTNNSKNTIIYLNHSMKLKDGVSLDQFKSLLIKHAQESDSIKYDDGVVSAETYRVADPNESIRNIEMCIGSSMWVVNNEKVCDLIEPLNTTIVYAGSDKKLHMVSYSYETGKVSVDSKTRPFKAKADHEIGNVIPETDSRFSIITSDYEDYSYTTIYDCDADYFKTYIQKCKDAGFNDIIEEKDKSFEAVKDNYNLSLSYNESEEYIYAHIKLIK